MSLLDRHADKWAPEPNTGCLIWTGAISSAPASRPMVGIAGNKVQVVARLICEEAYGPPPTSKHQAAHNTPNGCIGGLCVEPRHLRWATPRENLNDRTPEMKSKGGFQSWVNSKEPRNRGARDDAKLAGQEFYIPDKWCRRGHTGLYRVTNGCQECVKLRNLRRYER